MKNNQAFTLIELLVVIAIVGILVGFIVVSLGRARETANDARRKADVNQLTKQVMIYKTDHSDTALPVSAGCGIGDDCSNDVLTVLGEASSLRDPDNTGYYTYSSDGSNFVINSELSTDDNYYFDSSTGSYSTSSSNPPIPGSAVCGASDNTNRYTIPTTDLCVLGTPSAVSGSGPWTWDCVGTTTDSCSANMIIDGICGSAANTEHSSIPSTNLCFSGTASEVGGDGVPYAWLCTGENTGANVSCEATKTGWINTGLGFCVMKYEAKIQGNNNGNQTYSSSYVPESRSSGTPWVNITQSQAITECSSLGTGYHLITNNEWTALARHLAAQYSNWSNGSVGDGVLSRGFSASTTYASDGFNNSGPATSTGTGYEYNTAANTVGYSGVFTLKRTHTLANNQVVWDLAGNVWEWNSGTCTQGSGLGNWYNIAAWIEWSDANLADYELGNAGPNPLYTSTQNAGRFYGCTANGNGLLRGGNFGSGLKSGLGALSLTKAPSDFDTGFGFRCTK